MANTKKYDYKKICRDKGLTYIKEENPYIYFKDEMGFVHKRGRAEFIRGGGATIKSLDDKSLVTEYFLASLRHKIPEVFSESSFEKFIYTGALSYAVATCLKHGDYRTKPNRLLTDGHHCKECWRIENSKSKYLSQEEFLKRSRKVHGDRYDYSKTEYISARDSVTITCKTHGDFETTAYYHIQGSGCQTCGALVGGYGRSDYRNLCPNGSNVYVAEFTIGEEVFIKIGISKEVDRRVAILRKVSGGDVKLLYQEFYKDAGVAWDVELMLHRGFKGYSHTPKVSFKGETECFDITIKDEAIKLLQCVA